LDPKLASAVPAQPKETAQVFVRHIKNCRNKSARKSHRKCCSPKYLYMYQQGKVRRVSAKTSSWTRAGEKGNEIRRLWVEAPHRRKARRDGSPTQLPAAHSPAKHQQATGHNPTSHDTHGDAGPIGMQSDDKRRRERDQHEHREDQA
jgi:hypothetical protein